MRATLEPLGRTFMGDRFQSFLGDPALLKKVALGLSQRGLVAVKDGRARLAKTGRRILDPGRMLACVIAKSFVPRLTAKVLYLREDGYLLVSPSQSDELTTWLSWIPGSVPKRRIFERLMKGLAAAPETPGYVRSRKPIVRQAPSPAETLRPVPTDRTLPLGTDAPTIIVAPAAGRLRLVEGGTLGRPGTTVYPLKEGAVLGREAGCQIHLEDAVLSRRHCQFTRHPDGAWWIEDLKSSNGTFVNDDRLTAPRALRPGDRIKVGGEILLFETELHS